MINENKDSKNLTIEQVLELQKQPIVSDKETSFALPEKKLPTTNLTEEEIVDSLDNKDKLSKLASGMNMRLGDDISEFRKFNYGRAQETHIIGNLYRQGKAFFDSATSDETYTEAARRIEAERQKAIFEKFPEFKGKEEDAAVLAGRIATGFYDPVALLIPWTRIAKYGMGATIATGSSFTAGDAALREWSLTGNVSPLNIGISAGVGGVATGISSVIADKVRKAIPGGKLITVDDKGNPVVTNMSRIDAEETLGDLSPEIKKGLELVSDDVYKVSGPYIARFSKDLESLGVKYNKRLIARNELKKHQKQLDQLKRIGLDKQGELFKGGQLERVKKIISKQKKLVDKYQKEIDDILIEQMPEDLGIVGFESFKKAYQAGLLKGKIGEQLTRAFVQEAVRPILGGIGGFAVGTILGEDRNDQFMTAAIGSGIALGIISKRLELDKGIPKEVVSLFKKEGEKVFKRNWRTALNLNIFGSATHAAYMQSRMPVLQQFGEDLFGRGGNAYDFGKPMRESIEELKYTSNDYFRKQVFDLLQDVDDETVLTAGRIIQQKDSPSGMKYNFVEKGDLDNKQAVELADKFIGIRKEIRDYAKQTGLTFTELDSYGLTQILDSEAVKRMGFGNAQKIIAQAFKIQSQNLSAKDSKVKVLTDKEADKLAIKFLNNSDNVRRQEVLGRVTITDDTLKFIKNDGTKLKKRESLLQASEYLSKERTLVDPEARAFAKQLFIQDPEFTTLRLAESVVPIAEFARRFGEKGQGLRKIYADIKKYYGQFGNVNTNASLQKLVREDFEQIRNSVNAYFGVFDLQKEGVRGTEGFKSLILTLQFLLSTTKLTKVALPSLGDLLQVIQNSGFKAAANSAYLQLKQRGSKAVKPSASLAQRSPTDETGIIFKEPIFGRKFKNRKYRNTLARELSDFSQTATTRYQKGLVNFQGRFFEIVQLGRVTRFAREFAYDAGAFRVFDLGKKAATGKLSRAEIREINLLGFKPEEIKFLNNFKNMDDAFEDAQGKIVINIAGRRSADRDALIPQIGNRRLFSQSRDPMMKFAGSFLSWAQAKATQTNSLVRRIEDGDAKLALYMLSALPIYGAVRSLQIAMNSSEEFRDEHPNYFSGFETREELQKFIADSLAFSGQTLPFSIDKIVNFLKYSGSDITESIYPVIGVINDLAGAVKTGVRGKPRTGLTKAFEAAVPFGKDITRSTEIVPEVLGLDDSLAELAKEADSDRSVRLNFVTGGEIKGVADVPFTKENPADRINPYTGEPYSGLVIEDFPLLNRMPMDDGGLTDEQKSIIDEEIRRLGGVRSGELQSRAPVIELLVSGVPRIIAGVGRQGYKLIDDLSKNSKRAPKPLRYYHGSTLKLKEITPMADRVDPKLQNMFQAASYLGKPTEGGLDIANYYARGGGFVNIIDEKVFNKIVKNLYNPRNISDNVLKNINKEITTRKNLIDFAKRTNTRKNLGKFRKELIDLENLVKPYGSGYISKVSPVQRKVLKREGFDGIDISDDVIAVFDKLPVRRAARGSLTDKLLKRRQLKELEKAQLKKVTNNNV